MPRPNAAQLAYGSATVVFSTVALLLLSRATTGAGIALIGVASLLLGLLVVLTMPVAARRRTRASRAAAPVPAQDETIRVPAAHVGAGADTRIGS
ncbi:MULTISPECIES: hypothetical protein [Streptomyces]|uniref:Secreted protein n=1 Tax=Streptomyces solicathayae TaxID=3081768 RepID=A0ABZ0LXG9_9ACTN|nr:hypothetical protein [Streptomyces sp. HUAS YS2]WOX24121.1 hypothetical protein R2D22_23160 [Streptomyces sp. HUAS YS2]